MFQESTVSQGLNSHQTPYGQTRDGHDCAAQNIIFCTRTEPNPMSRDWARSLYSIISNADFPVVFVDYRSYRNLELKNAQFHPAFKFLSATHKRDYLRAYLINYF